LRSSNQLWISHFPMHASWVGVVTRLWNWYWGTEVWLPAGAGDISPLHYVQTVSVDPSALYSVRTKD
jgi:hypothetical protein